MLTKIINIQLLLILIVASNCLNIVAQDFDYGDDEVDLWEYDRQNSQSGNDPFYTPRNPNNSSTPNPNNINNNRTNPSIAPNTTTGDQYISEEELNQITNQPETSPQPIFEDNMQNNANQQLLARQDLVYKNNLLKTYYLTNVTYGVINGIMIGGLVAVDSGKNARQILSHIGIGLFLGGLFSYSLAKYLENDFLDSAPPRTALLKPALDKWKPLTTAKLDINIINTKF